jgi:hypothetical protein
MLIEKRNAPEINDIVTIKLISGEEIVGRMIDRNSDSISLAKPVTIIVQPISANQMGLAFRPVLGSVGEHVTVPFAFAVMTVRPIKTGDDVVRNYIHATTGLVSADQMPVLQT